MANTYCSGTRADQCHDLPCYVSSFTVNITQPQPGTVRATVVDSCNVLTGPKMLSAVLRSGLLAAMEADGIDDVEGCCRNVSEWDLNVGGKYMTRVVGGLGSGGFTAPAAYVVTKPFTSG